MVFQPFCSYILHLHGHHRCYKRPLAHKPSLRRTAHFRRRHTFTNPDAHTFICSPQDQYLRARGPGARAETPARMLSISFVPTLDCACPYLCATCCKPIPAQTCRHTSLAVHRHWNDTMRVYSSKFSTCPDSSKSLSSSRKPSESLCCPLHEYRDGRPDSIDGLLVARPTP